jgi:hypothetical protein
MEQSPIALFRSHEKFKDFYTTAYESQFVRAQFSDNEFKYEYQPNTKDSYSDIWTGTSFQVGLDYRTDHFTTSVIKFFEQDESKHHLLENFTTRAMQFHFHNPGEHTVDGEEMDMEMHIVHKLMYV